MQTNLVLTVVALLTLTQCATTVQTKESQAATTPSMAIHELEVGNKRFAAGASRWRNLPAQVKLTSKGQYPIAAVVSCMDSRTSSELIFDQGLGDIFNVRVAGNVINNDGLGSLEYGCYKAGAKAVLVVGHTKCGAVHGAIDNVQLGNLTGLLAKIKPAVALTPQGPDYEDRVSANNVRLGVKEIRKRSDILRKLESQGKIKIQGALYHVDTGIVELLQP